LPLKPGWHLIRKCKKELTSKENGMNNMEVDVGTFSLPDDIKPLTKARMYGQATVFNTF